MRICIYGAASTQIPQFYKDAVMHLCEALARRGHTLVFGAGDGGLMGAAARGFHNEGAHVMGVAPTFFKETVIEKLYEKSDVIVYTESMGMRKSIMESNADAFIVFPGGIGTYDELFQILTLKQLKVLPKQIAVFNIRHFYDPIANLMERGLEEKFLRSDTMDLYRIFSDEETDELIAYLEETPPETDPIVEQNYGN